MMPTKTGDDLIMISEMIGKPRADIFRECPWTYRRSAAEGSARYYDQEYGDVVFMFEGNVCRKALYTPRYFINSKAFVLNMWGGIMPQTFKTTNGIYGTIDNKNKQIIFKQRLWD